MKWATDVDEHVDMFAFILMGDMFSRASCGYLNHVLVIIILTITKWLVFKNKTKHLILQNVDAPAILCAVGLDFDLLVFGTPEVLDPHVSLLPTCKNVTCFKGKNGASESERGNMSPKDLFFVRSFLNAEIPFSRFTRS
ncbi:hypothetical protein ACJX0J_010108 [Zea mays]